MRPRSEVPGQGARQVSRRRDQAISRHPVGSGLSRGTELVSRLARGIRVRSRRHSVVRQHRSYILDKNERAGVREQGFLLKNIKERVFFRVPRRRVVAR